MNRTVAKLRALGAPRVAADHAAFSRPRGGVGLGGALVDARGIRGAAPGVGEHAGGFGSRGQGPAQLLPSAPVLLPGWCQEMARAMAIKPKLLLMDEVTGGVDQKTIPGLVELIKKLRSLGVTIITIEHNINIITLYK